MALPPQPADLESRLARRLDEALDDYRRAVEQRLREVGDRIAAAARELPSPSPARLLDGLGIDALDLGSRRDAARESAADLLAALRDLDRARTQAEALDVLLDRAAAVGDRAALLLVRDGELVGWGERGFGGGFGGRSLERSAAARLLTARGCLRLEAGEAAALLGESGVAAGGAAPNTTGGTAPNTTGGTAVVVPLVLRDRIAALLWADRAQGENETAVLQILAAATAQRLELQALSDRAWTPTLYDEADAAGEPLPLWEPLAVEPAPEPAPDSEGRAPMPGQPEAPPISAATAEAPAVDAWQPLAAPAPEPVGETSFAPSVEPPFEPITEPADAGAAETAVDELFEAAPAEPASGAESAVEPLPEFEYAAEEPENPAQTAAFETFSPPASAPADLLGTVRMPLAPLAPIEPAIESSVEEKTAPFELRRDLPLAALPPEPDLTEDATLLTRRPALLPPVAPPVEPTSTTTEPAPVDEDVHDRTAARGRTTQVAPPPDVQGPGLAFMAGRSARSVSESPVHEEAKRLARLLISEIKLYNEEQVIEGRRNRDLYHRLREDIDRSRQIFEERVDPTVRGENDYFQQELVRSLAGGDPRALGI